MQPQPIQPQDGLVVRCNQCGGHAVDVTRDGVDEHGDVTCQLCRTDDIAFRRGERSIALALLEQLVERIVEEGAATDDEIRAVVECAVDGRRRAVLSEVEMHNRRVPIYDAYHGAGEHDVQAVRA